MGDMNWVAMATLLLAGGTTLGGAVFGLVKYIISVKEDLRKDSDSLRDAAFTAIGSLRTEVFTHFENLESDLRKAIEHNKGESQLTDDNIRRQISDSRKELEVKLQIIDDRLYNHVKDDHHPHVRAS